MQHERFDCAWCGRPHHEHSGWHPEFGGPLCLTSAGHPVGSQVYTPRISLDLDRALGACVAAQTALSIAIASLKQVLET